MKCLIIGGNRFVGLRLSVLLDQIEDVELSILNRTGQAPHCKRAVIHKGDRRNLHLTYLERDWDVVIDFACYTEADATSAVDYFQRVKRYILISTASVYDAGEDRREEGFSAERWNLKADAEPTYQDGKRRCEAVFVQRSTFDTLRVRFPYILGPDDYTRRLEFHVEKVLRGEKLFVPNLEAAISMIHAEDAANFLFWALMRDVTGALNVASPRSITMKKLLGQIQLVTGRAPVLSVGSGAGPDADAQSPYGGLESATLNVDRLFAAGFKTRPIADWLPELIGVPSGAPAGPAGTAGGRETIH